MYKTQRWIAVDIPFTATDAVKNIDEAIVDVTFHNIETDTTLVLPAFWNGGTEWIVRFAPTECGEWEFCTLATGKDIGLDGIEGTVTAEEYTGELEIYKRGFLKTEKDVRYLMYNDGTPFFYLADTHWNLMKEEFDEPGPNAGTIKCDSHFKYIADNRWAQGFTVYQSEPIGRTYKVEDGTIDENDIDGFKHFDRYFKYLADLGFVHANAELIFPTEATEEFHKNLHSLVRYWVARYSAYPVLWSLGQEVDDGWKKVEVYKDMCRIITEIDPYKHPTSAHQLNTMGVGCLGDVPVAMVDGGYNEYNPEHNERTYKNRKSAFYDVPGHTWWAIQWRPCVDQQYNFNMPKDYWENGQKKPIINFEGRYDHLYTKEFGARAQGWITYLCGIYGYAYGCADMWLYQGRYAIDKPGFDGVEVISCEDKLILWSELIHAPISDHMTYIRKFFDSIEWWRLVPDYDYGKVFTHLSGRNYVVSHIEDELYVVYLYDRALDGVGKIIGLDENATYTARWYNTRSGEYTVISDSVSGSEYVIPEKPEAMDLIFTLSKN